ncbi:MAG: DUF3450 family protein [Limisphaerales bacterium]
MFRRVLCSFMVLVAGLRALGADPGPEAKVAETRALIEQWVQTRQLADRTRTDWASERALLEQSRALFEKGLQDEAERMTRIGTNVAQVGLDRQAAEKELAVATDALVRLAGIVGGFEQRVRALQPLLPEPLLPAVQPFLNRLPTNSVATAATVPERMQAVVGFLNEVDKFNSTVTVADEKRPDAAGQLVSVEVVYLGLGLAYFADATGTLAGFGQPGPEGWQWTTQAEIGPAVRNAVAMYRNEQPAAFVNLPAAIR